MSNQSKKQGFTFIEIILVVGLITMITMIGVGSYTTILKKGRDNRRKADLEEIRSALEMYRSANNVYPTSAPNPGFPFGSSFGDGTNTYLQKAPQDPVYPRQTYYYTTNGSDYTIATQLEGTSTCSSPPASSSCGTGYNCNYCLGSYGQK